MPRTSFIRLAQATALALLAAPLAARAQSAVIYGQLGNFDISNDSGGTCHGFEMEIDGVPQSEIPNISFFSTNRYGMPAIVPFGTGVKVTWQSPFDAATQSWSTRTLPHTVSWFPGQCYQWVTATYEDGGCEHFGVRTAVNTGPVRSRWLCEDAAAPGSLVPVDPPTAVAGPTYFIQPPVAANNPPALVVEVEAPEPAEAINLFGDAQWIRIFRRELPNPVALDQLVADNPDIVPMNAAQLEADYDILQDEPAAGGKGNRRRKRHDSPIDPATRAVVRRIELYRYTGAYDAVTHEALCADLTCSAPSAGELGELISVQMTAANVAPDAVIVSKAGTGGGNVDSTDKVISCGNKCAASYTAGNLVTLTVKPNSNSVFTGWRGACSGTATSCTVTVNGPVAATAVFDLRPASGGGGGGGGTTSGKSFTLSVGKSNTGYVSASPVGNDRALDCGGACSAKFTGNTVVTLTATPPAGKAFVSWSGACAQAGANPVCTVTIAADASTVATFSK